MMDSGIRKKIYLLIGYKGGGKSQVGMLFHKYRAIRFVRVEDWAKQIRRERDVCNEAYIREVFETIERGIREALQKEDQIVFESTGLSDAFDRMLKRLQTDFRVVTIRVIADRIQCLDRVRKRDQSLHIPVSDEQLELINEEIAEKQIACDFSIDNRRAGESELISSIDQIIVTGFESE